MKTTDDGLTAVSLEGGLEEHLASDDDDNGYKTENCCTDNLISRNETASREECSSIDFLRFLRRRSQYFRSTFFRAVKR